MRISSRAIARLTPDWVRPNASPARAKFPVSTTAAITPTPPSSLPSRPMMISYHLKMDKSALAASQICADLLRITATTGDLPMKLAGQRIVILGGSSGIGLATAQAAAREGAAVVIASSRKRRVEEALVALPAGAEGHALDLTDEGAVKALFAELGPFDHLAFTAGETLQLDRLAEVGIAAARHFFALRYWGAFMAAKYGSGRIR